MADNGTGWRNRIVGHGEKSADQFQAHPRNWRQHPKAQRQALAASLNGVGWVDTVIENVTTGHLLDGHERIWQALDRGDSTPVPFTQVELTEDEEHLVLATFDSITQMAVTDGETLEDLLSDLRVSDLVVGMPDLDALLHEVAARADVAYGEFVDAGDDPGADMDRAEELREKWQTERGQVWEVPSVTTPGKVHRVMCGDSTSVDNVARLMDGEKANAVVTDPPYGINREGITNDDPVGLKALFDGVLAVMPITDAVLIAFQSPRLFPVWLDATREAGQKFERALWFYDQTDVTFPWRGWLMTSQIALVSTIGKALWGDGVYHHDCYIVETAGKQNGTGGHTTVKPLDVIVELVKHTRGLIYDPFLGSGTTAVAAEQTGRLCYGMELEPKYVAVTLERLSGMGLEPELTS